MGARRGTSFLLFTAAALAAAAGFGALFVGVPGTGLGTVVEAEPGPPVPGRTVVLELFTSEGCSSCPPADRLLARLATEPELDGKVIPLALHVDYWNYLGWSDPFSSARWSERQEGYARELSGRLYTPQLVVDGRHDVVGSKEGDVREAIRRALAVEPAGRLELTVGAAEAGHLPVTLTAELAPERASGPADVVLVLFENGLSTSVPRGENAGRELRHEYVVRHLEKVFRLGREDGRAHREATLSLKPDWDPARLGVAAFLQDPKSLEILAATRGDQPRSAR